MPCCPKCRTEYREGFTVCGDCDVPLVDALPPAENPKESEARFDTESFLVTVSDEVQASVVESLLRSCDIPSARTYREAGGYVRVMTGASSFGIDIYVPSLRLDEARGLLDAGLLQPPESEDKTILPLPRTGSSRHDVGKRIVKWLILVVFVAPPVISWLVKLARYVLGSVR